MTKIDFIAYEKSGVNHITLTPSHKAEETHVGIIDGALILGLMAALVGLIFLLVK